MFIVLYKILFEMEIKGVLVILIISCAIIFYSEFVIVQMILIVSSIKSLILTILIDLTSLSFFFTHLNAFVNYTFQLLKKVS